MRRREFITLLGGAAVGWPLTTHAQQAAMPVIGFLSGVSAGPFAQRLSAFHQGLNETGTVEGRNVAIVTWFGVDLVPKQLSLLHELVPDAAVIALLVDLNASEMSRHLSEVQEAARTLRLQLVPLNTRTPSDIDMAFASLARERASALVVGGGGFLVSRRNQIIALAARHAIPAIYGFREYSADGGLISYGNDIPDAFRRAGIYTGRILKGDKPADLPVERPTKFELVINLKTAKSLGLEMPSSLIARADEVIE